MNKCIRARALARSLSHPGLGMEWHRVGVATETSPTAVAAGAADTDTDTHTDRDTDTDTGTGTGTDTDAVARRTCGSSARGSCRAQPRESMATTLGS